MIGIATTVGAAVVVVVLGLVADARGAAPTSDPGSVDTNGAIVGTPVDVVGGPSGVGDPAASDPTDVPGGAPTPDRP